MDVTNQRRSLGAIAGVLLIGAAGAIAWSLSGIDASETVVDAPGNRQVQPADSSGVNRHPLDEAIASQLLRGPLYDQPAAPPRVEPPPNTTPPPRTSDLDVTLVGTIIETDQSLAILADASGKFDVKGVGESLELSPPGITVENIESEQVTLGYRGRKSMVQLDRNVKKSAGGVKRANERRRNR